MIEQEYDKIDDYILRVDVKLNEGSDNGVRKYNSYTRMFNFLARQVTTIHRDWLYEGRGSSAAGDAAIATHERTESFDDLPSAAEVKYMHGKLVELGGRPPALEEVLPEGLDKPGPRLRAPGRNR